MHIVEKEFKILNPKQFPKLLTEINDAPKQLYIEGELPDNEENIFLAVIGTRKFSTYGKEACKKIISGLAGYPIVIVSGLALGIDAIAHKAAIDAGLKTVAVPGSGLDYSVLHPHSNRKLADEIVASGGALISELEPTQPAGVHTFPQRNRIIAGLSQAILVIEAPKRSGTSITARLALDYNRDVYAVPGSIFSINSLGSNRLIKQGATPISSSEDLLEALGFDIKLTEYGQKEIKNLSKEEQKILDILTEPFPRDELIRQSGMLPNAANSLLMMMEIKNLVKESGGQIFRK